MKKIFSFALAALMVLLPSVQSFAGSDPAAGLQALEEKNISLNDQLELFSGSFENAADGALLAENYLVYTPGGDVIPSVCFGHDVAGAAGFGLAAQIEAEAGNFVTAGVNGDFFTLATGVAMGLIIRDGEICSSERISCESIGFREDGTAIIGKPGLNVVFSDAAAEVSYSNLCFNKSLTADDGLVVYSSHFGADNAAGAARSILVRIVDGSPKPGETITGIVEDKEISESSFALNDGFLVLSVREDTPYPSVLSAYDRIQPGDEVTVLFSVSDEWLDIVNAVGAERRLVVDGEAVDWSSESGRAPRTAAGLREDGSLVVYTADGRKSAHSAGLTYSELAQRMADLGCVQAVNLDGGDSTQMHAIYPGNEAFSLINSPSGTSLRRCADYLCFINRAEATGDPAHLNVYPYSVRLLAGASVQFETRCCDDNWYFIDISEKTPHYTVPDPRLGSIDEAGLFTAGSRSAEGIVLSGLGRLSGTAEIEVIADPDAVNVYDADGKAVGGSLSVYAGESVSLTAEAVYRRAVLLSDVSCFAWAVDEALGTIENGVFTAADTDFAEGAITVSAGETQQSIAVTVYRDKVPPVISGGVSDGLLSAEVTDALDPAFGKQGLSVRYDGESLDFAWIPSVRMLSAVLPEGDGDLHHIVIEATDWRGNRSRLGIDVPTQAPEGSEAKEAVFSDMLPDNEDTPYAEYLYRNGIMAGKLIGDERVFDAPASLSRQEFAAVLCNWLGFDVQTHAADELPFTDTGMISSWAVPYVSTVYAEGLMAGKAAGGDSLRFDPLGTLTRQEVMTVLAKLLGEGYAAQPLTAPDAAEVAAWALPFVERCLSNGITDGAELIRPAQAVTRGELARMMVALD